MLQMQLVRTVYPFQNGIHDRLRAVDDRTKAARAVRCRVRRPVSSEFLCEYIGVNKGLPSGAVKSAWKVRSVGESRCR